MNKTIGGFELTTQPEKGQARQGSAPKQSAVTDDVLNSTSCQPPAQRVSHVTTDAIAAGITEVISKYVDLRPTGSASLRGLCPFHDEKTPSFHVHRKRQRFHCFGCGLDGDALDFIQGVERVGFRDAVHIASEILGISATNTVSDRDYKILNEARQGLRLWREQATQQHSEALRDRDQLRAFAGQIVAEYPRNSTALEAAWDLLSDAYHGYSILEWNWERLRDARNDSLELWRELKAEGAR